MKKDRPRSQESQRTQEFYAALYRKHGPSVRALGMGSRNSQEVRFRQFVRFLDLSGASVLDAGCGFGDLLGFLDANGQPVERYLGVDISRDAIDTASARFKNDDRAAFICGDIEDVARAANSFDYVLISGTLALETESADEYNERVEAILRVAWQGCARALAFNMMNELAIRRHPNAAQMSCDGKNYDPAFWLRFVMSEFSPKVQLVSDYHDLDYTLIVHRLA